MCRGGIRCKPRKVVEEENQVKERGWTSGIGGSDGVAWPAVYLEVVFPVAEVKVVMETCLSKGGDELMEKKLQGVSFYHSSTFHSNVFQLFILLTFHLSLLSSVSFVLSYSSLFLSILLSPLPSPLSLSFSPSHFLQLFPPLSFLPSPFTSSFLRLPSISSLLPLVTFLPSLLLHPSFIHFIHFSFFPFHSFIFSLLFLFCNGPVVSSFIHTVLSFTFSLYFFQLISFSLPFITFLSSLFLPTLTSSLTLLFPSSLLSSTIFSHSFRENTFLLSHPFLFSHFYHIIIIYSFLSLPLFLPSTVIASSGTFSSSYFTLSLLFLFSSLFLFLVVVSPFTSSCALTSSSPGEKPSDPF